MRILFIFILIQVLESFESNVIVLKFHRIRSIYNEPNDNFDNIYVNQRINNPYRTFIKLGDPFQLIPSFLKTDEYNFYLSNSNCSQYEMYYKTISKDFEFITPEEYIYDFEINEFYIRDSFFLGEFNEATYTEIKIYNYSLNANNNLNGPQCFHVGSQIVVNAEQTRENLIHKLFKMNYIKSSFYEYTIINDDQMYLSMGLDLKQENLKQYKFIEPIISETEIGKNKKWGIALDNINIKRDTNSHNYTKINAEFDINIGCFIGSTAFHENFKQYLKDNNILVEPKIKDQKYFYFFHQNLYEIEKLKNFEIVFYNQELNYNFTFNFSDLMLNKSSGYFFLIAFEINNATKIWKFGYPFFKKYKFVFDIDSQKMGFLYQDSNKNNTKKGNFNLKNPLIIIGIIIIVIILLLAGFFIGKKIYEARKKTTNELSDLYENKENEQKEEIVDKNEE